MNFLEKIDLLKNYKGLNNHTLSIACGIPYTTIDGWYKKGYDRIKLSHLRKLGDCFAVSLDFLIRDDIDFINSFLIIVMEEHSMTLLERLEMLMSDKNINKRQLSIGSKIPYSTIDNLWKKGYKNIKLSNLKKIANYFGVSLDYLVGEDFEDSAIDPNFLSVHERKLIAAYREKGNMRVAIDTLLGISEEMKE